MGAAIEPRFRTEAGQVDRDEVGVLGEPVPGRREGEQALGPRVQQQRVDVARGALGVADLQPVERLPRSRVAVVDTSHFTWESAPGEYARLVTGWWETGHEGA
jgi:hypothetical protein